MMAGDTGSEIQNSMLVRAGARAWTAPGDPARPGGVYAVQDNGAGVPLKRAVAGTT